MTNYMDDFNANMAIKDFSPSTQKSYCYKLNLFLRHCQKKKKQINSDTFKNYSEVVNLTTEDIFGNKSRLRIRQGKGKKDQYTILSDRTYKPKNYLFAGRKPRTNLSIRSAQHAYYKALKNSDISKKCGIHTL